MSTCIVFEYVYSLNGFLFYSCKCYFTKPHHRAVTSALGMLENSIYASNCLNMCSIYRRKVILLDLMPLCFPFYYCCTSRNTCWKYSLLRPVECKAAGVPGSPLTFKHWALEDMLRKTVSSIWVMDSNNGISAIATYRIQPIYCERFIRWVETLPLFKDTHQTTCYCCIDVFNTASERNTASKPACGNGKYLTFRLRENTVYIRHISHS